MRSILYFLTFFTVTPIALATSLFALSVLNRDSVSVQITQEIRPSSTLSTPLYGSRVYAALPDNIGKVEGFATTQDARAEIIRQYLEKYNSPLEPYSQELVDVSDRYDLDFRLLTAIAQQESNLCKKIPSGTYNCWGWGIHSRGTLGFASYPEAIDAVAKGLREDYLDKGYTTPEEIMSKYTPLSSGSWAAGVEQFLTEME